MLSTLDGVRAFPDRRVALIVGGADRGIDYSELGTGLRARTTPLLLLTVPQNGPRIRAEVSAADPGPAVEIIERPGLAAAVATAHDWALPDGVVLLSPAAPSFGLFRDYRERGEVFVSAMKECGASASATTSAAQPHDKVIPEPPCP